jgi:ABC-type tungstate transport system substrate-binding protein
MSDIGHAFLQAFTLIARFDPKLIEIIWLSLRASLSASFSYTRTMTTTIALETSKGDLALALGLGLILILLSAAVGTAAFLLSSFVRR